MAVSPTNSVCRKDNVFVINKSVTIASKKTGLYADKQDEQVENKVIYKQADNLLNNTENKQSFNLPDLGLSSALSLLTPEPNSNDEQQIPVKRKKKKSQRGFKW